METVLPNKQSELFNQPARVTSINNGTYTETYGYDLLDRLNSTVGPWGTVSYGYDPVGNRLSKSNGGSTITYTYDEMIESPQPPGLSSTGMVTVT